MVKIKIISNPYSKETRFERWDAESNEWIAVGYENNASSDVVPICVLGNYSVGKSTFINALIGSEILPSGPEPVTAKVYKISRSKYKDRAQVRWKYWDQEMQISFSDRETVMEQSMKDSPLGKALMEGRSYLYRVFSYDF